MSEIASKPLSVDRAGEMVIDAALSYYIDSSNRFKFERLWDRMAEYYKLSKEPGWQTKGLEPKRKPTGIWPCPFCKGDNVVLSHRAKGWKRKVFYFWRCLSCEAAGPETEIKERAYQLWSGLRER